MTSSGKGVCEAKGLAYLVHSGRLWSWDWEIVCCGIRSSLLQWPQLDTQSLHTLSPCVFRYCADTVGSQWPNIDSSASALQVTPSGHFPFLLLWTEVARSAQHQRNAEAFLKIFVALSRPWSLRTLSWCSAIPPILARRDRVIKA